jgi:2-oxoglutarate dehydrogenase E2 component (dihydrolipoamide succinyltransferase)
MAEYKLLMPKMGESVIEATILSWQKKVGDTVQEHDVVLEVATDKVDSEVPSPVNGVIIKILHGENEVVGVGEPLAIIEVEGDAPAQFVPEKKKIEVETQEVSDEKIEVIKIENEIPKVEIERKNELQDISPKVEITQDKSPHSTHHAPLASAPNKYYSPLVMNIAQAENISMQELEDLSGSGMDGRVTKEDVLEFVDKKKKALTNSQLTAYSTQENDEIKPALKLETKTEKTTEHRPSSIDQSSNIEIIEMDRMRKLIAQHMINSKNTAPHVTSIVECDVTNIVNWRTQNKAAFQKREGFGLTFMPIFIEAIAKTIKEYPMINISVDGDRIIKKRTINIGVATALPSGNLIVPVIKNTDQKNLLGIARAMNELIQRARTNTLQPDDVMEGTYTITNIGSFGNIIGTPIINQPQVAIMAVGAITKKPVVIEVDGQDVIAIRHMMYLSHTYDHRVVDGQLGGLFVKKMSDFLEKFDLHQEI